MSFQLEDLARSLNSGTVVTVLIVGLVVGSLLIRRAAVYPRHVLWMLVVSGTAWTAALMVIRFVQGAELWETYLGAVLLWWLFCAAAAVGVWLRS